ATYVNGGLLASVLLDDSFDTENAGAGTLNYTGFARWNVTRGSVDLLGNGFFDQNPGNGLYVDLDGSTFSAGRMESKSLFTLTRGTYQLTFSLGNSDGVNTATVSLGDVYSEPFTRTGALPFETVTRTITVSAATTARLVFDHEGADNEGLLIDNIR